MLDMAGIFSLNIILRRHFSSNWKNFSLIKTCTLDTRMHEAHVNALNPKCNSTNCLLWYTKYGNYLKILGFKNNYTSKMEMDLLKDALKQQFFVSDAMSVLITK